MKKIFLIVLVFVSVVYASSLLDRRLETINNIDNVDRQKANEQTNQEIQFRQQHPFISNYPLINDIGKSLVDTGKFVDDSFSKIASLADPNFTQTDQNNPIYQYAENVGKAQQMLPNTYDGLTGLIAWIIDIVILLVLFKIITKMALKVRALF